MRKHKNISKTKRAFTRPNYKTKGNGKPKKILFSKIKPRTNSNLAQSNHRVQIKPTCQIGFKPYESGGNSVNRHLTVDFTKSDQLESHITILNGSKQIYLTTPIYFRRPKK